MGEYVWSTMTIGGSLPKAKAQEFLNRLRDEFPEDFGDADLSCFDVYSETSGNITVSGEVNYGNPNSLIEFCRENNLPYWRHWDCKSGVFDSGVCVWEPGMPKDEERETGAASESSEPMITLYGLQAAKERGETLEEVIKRLAKFDPNVVPPFVLEAEPVTVS